MAIENAKTLNVRIKNKYDSYENWAASGLVLEAGEIAIAYSTIDVKVDNGDVKHPFLLMKVGDGEKTFANLPWLSAKAADVLEAAKSEAGLTAFVKNVIAAADGDLAVLEGRVADVEGAIETLNGNDETVGSVAKAIKDAIAALDLANTYAAKTHEHTKAEITDFAHNHEMGEINGLAAEFAKKVGKETGKSLVADTEIERLAAMSDGANKVEASEANGKIKIDGVETVVYTHPAEHAMAEITGLATALAGKQDVIPENTYDAHGAADQALKDAKDYADGKVASVTAADASVTIAGTATAPTVAAKLSADADNALTLAADGLKVVIPAAAEYSIVKAADSGDYAAVYNLTKDGAIVGASINIPKDMVVKSGSVVGDEIVLVLNDEAATEIKIPVASLIEYVTSGSAAGDMVVVNVSDDHKVTATITDGTITLAKLTTEVQTAIGKAHSHENADVLAGIDADKVAAWDASEQNAKDHADDLNDSMNTRVEALEAIDHEHANKALLDTYTQTEADLADAVSKKHTHENATELDKFVDGDKAKLDGAVQTVTAAAGSGLKAVKTGTDVAITIDDTLTWVFDCGNSGVTA